MNPESACITREGLRKFSEAQSTDLAALKNKQATELKDAIQQLLVSQAIELAAFDVKQRSDLAAAEADAEKAEADVAAMIADLKAAVEARSAYDRDHPDQPKPLREEVLTAMRREDVAGARSAFLAYVGEVTSDRLIPTNYYDQVLGVAVSALKDETDRDAFVRKLSRLAELYLAFVDALAPYQPDPEDISSRKDVPRLPWEADIEDTACKVFYFLEGSGGYWISRGDELRSVVALTASGQDAVVAAAAAEMLPVATCV